MRESPSWAAPPSPERPDRDGQDALPRTLVVAAALCAVLAVVEVVFIAGRDELVPALRVFLAVVVGSQVVLAWGLLRRSSGAALGVFLCEATAVVAAVAGGLGTGTARILLAAGALAVMVLLAMSLRAFPSPALPALPSRPAER